MALAERYLDTVRAALQEQKGLAERALAQLSDEELHRSPGEESNSVAILVQHIGGNLRSRWTDFLTTDGEKPDRDRDGEFVDQGYDRGALLQVWARGWSALFATLATLGEEDLQGSVTVRGVPWTVLSAIEKTVTHCSYHVGQIVYIGKALRDASWQTLTLARNLERGRGAARR